MNRKSVILFTAGIAICGMIASCSGPKEEHDRDDAREMYMQIARLTKEYTRRIAAAPDSAAWDKIAKTFEDSIAKVNFRFPADTDLELTEGENDTLFLLSQEYVRARNERIRSILHPVAVPDSVVNPEEDASHSHDN